MSISAIDQKLDMYRSELKRLEEARSSLEAKESQTQQIITDMEAACRAVDIPMEEIFRRLEKRIERWIKSRSNEDEGIHQHLKSYYARVISEGHKEKAKARPAEPKLPTGTYLNPYTQETLEKRTRTPAQLSEWVTIYGLGTVETWRR